MAVVLVESSSLSNRTKFKNEPNSFYIVESYDQYSTWREAMSGETKSSTASVLLDCRLSDDDANRPKIKWYKNDQLIDFNARLIKSAPYEEINRYIQYTHSYLNRKNDKTNRK